MPIAKSTQPITTAPEASVPILSTRYKVTQRVKIVQKATNAQALYLLNAQKVSTRLLMHQAAQA